MTNPKLNKIDAEFNRNCAKIAELQTRNRELDRQRTELKNNDILELVHEHELDYAALAALIRKLDSNRPAALAGEMENA